MRAVARITLSPFVETLPCVGGVSITLLKAPYFDAQFSLVSTLDILGLPLIHEAFQFGVGVCILHHVLVNEKQVVQISSIPACPIPGMSLRAYHVPVPKAVYNRV